MKKINKYITEKLKLNKDTKADFDLNKISMHSKIAINHFATMLKQGHYSNNYDVIADKILKWFEENNINEIEVYIDRICTNYFGDYKNFGFKVLGSLDFIKFKNSFNIPDKKSNGFPKEFTILHKYSQNYEGIAYYVNDEVFYIDTELWDILIVDNDKQYH